MIQFERETWSDLEAALRREWLETNGLGGFASSTIVGLNTRRYHGLLVAATKPPVGRLVLLSKLEETLLMDGRRFDLSANRYPGVVHPQGFQYLKQFHLDPFPVFTYEVEGIEMDKSVFMIHGENSVVIHYELRKNNRPEVPKNLRLEIRPLIAFRDYHGTTHENGVINPAVQESSGLASVTPYHGLPSLHLAHNAVELRKTGDWYRNFEYDAERERGLDCCEDLFNPFALCFDLRMRRQASIIASTERRDVAQAVEYRRAEITRRRKVLVASPIEDGFAQSLAAASDQYLVSRAEDKTVIAGYHWFGDWGRDTMIALPGLTLPTGKYEVARSILRTFAKHVDQGMLPNRFPDAGETPEYNTVDAALWFFEAARSYLAYTSDLEFVRYELYPRFADIISCHARGTRYGIKVDPSGLLASGEVGVQLTWMDAKVGDWVVTPRRGKPVEIQALWYNALCIMEDLASSFGDEAARKRYRHMATVAHWSFNRLFWNEGLGCLYDVVNGGPPDSSIRPNQIFAVSLPHSMLSRDRARSVVEKVEEHLLTPFGLRSLAPSDPQYHGCYAGGPPDRDGAYHRGTVWSWLLGPFITAYIRVNGGSEEARRQAQAWLSPLESHLEEAGLGHISEIFEGDAPHRPCGCIAQAWSVAETLRVYFEDVRDLRPSCDLVAAQPSPKTG
ncbi:MAG TPA: amylo-alpha-1,6-glucosidase [Candidatus Sulfotelmatobacter sp.]|nr:amylo-alpha-1,6-glucosidase [Candidatus Sulfotelmatobacter sp.]